MISLHTLRSQPEEIAERLSLRNLDGKAIVTELLEKDQAHREALSAFENAKAEMNRLSKTVGELMRSGKKDEAEAIKSETSAAKDLVKSLQEQATDLENQVQELLLAIPNAPHASVPKGNSAESNICIRESGMELKRENALLPHWEIMEKTGWIDFANGVKITGAGFPVYRGPIAKLQRALIQYFLSYNTESGYEEFQVPFVVNADSGFGTGQLPDKEGQMYYIGEDELYLIPTAEVPLTNLFRDTILSSEQLPVKLTGYTPCFRREAGSYGKDVRGLNRLHQFDKVEIVQICRPEDSYSVLEDMVAHVEGLVKSLELPYRILKLCGGDMGFASALTYDFEVWSAAQKRWLEISSVSNFESFQTNRLKLRFKDGQQKTQLAHSLNGSSLALPRVLAALIENNQNEQGIDIPAVLQPFMGASRIHYQA
jgi:seryl-tRNA synthetase